MTSNAPIESRPPLPTGVSVNGQRKISEPIKASLTIEPPVFQGNGQSGFGFHNLPTTPTSPLPPAPPSDPLLQPYHMMNLLRGTMVNASGGYVTRRLHVPCEVWSQGGAKLNNLDEKIRVVTILCGALGELEASSAEHFGAGNVSSGMALGIGSIGRKEADAWLSKLEDFSNVCDVVVADFGKKLGVGEGFVSRKSTWSYKLGRQFDKLTNGKKYVVPFRPLFLTYVLTLRFIALTLLQLMYWGLRSFSNTHNSSTNTRELCVRNPLLQHMRRFLWIFAYQQSKS